MNYCKIRRNITMNTQAAWLPTPTGHPLLPAQQLAFVSLPRSQCRPCGPQQGYSCHPLPLAALHPWLTVALCSIGFTIRTPFPHYSTILYAGSNVTFLPHTNAAWGMAGLKKRTEKKTLTFRTVSIDHCMHYCDRNTYITKHIFIDQLLDYGKKTHLNAPTHLSLSQEQKR